MSNSYSNNQQEVPRVTNEYTLELLLWLELDRLLPELHEDTIPTLLFSLKKRPVGEQLRMVRELARAVQLRYARMEGVCN